MSKTTNFEISKKLEIGDKIYKVNRHNKNIYEIYNIIKVDEKTAQTNTGFMLKRQIKNNICFSTNKSYYKFNSEMDYFIETQELKNDFEKQVLIEKFKNFDFKKLTLKVLQEINNKLIIKIL
jgi:hypothetical protein